MDPLFNNKFLLLMLIIIIIIIIVLFMAPSTESKGVLLAKTHVRLTNKLGKGIDLSLHCKSNDTDFNQTLLHYGEYFEFVFRPYFWGTTRFFCWFHWWSVHHYFDIYLQSRDYDLCGGKCWWVLNNFDGPCLVTPRTTQYAICYRWNKDNHSSSNPLLHSNEMLA